MQYGRNPRTRGVLLLSYGLTSQSIDASLTADLKRACKNLGYGDGGGGGKGSVFRNKKMAKNLYMCGRNSILPDYLISISPLNHLVSQ